jgi:hypothetical protein
MVGGSQRGGRFEMIRLEDLLYRGRDPRLYNNFEDWVPYACEDFERKRIRVKLLLTGVIRFSHLIGNLT